MTPELRAFGEVDRRIQLFWRPGVRANLVDGRVVVEFANVRIRFPDQVTPFETLFRQLETGLPRSELVSTVQSGDSQVSIELLAAIDGLSRRGLLEHAVLTSGGAELLRFLPQMPSFALGQRWLSPDARLTLSSFALVRRVGGGLLLESPLSDAAVRLTAAALPLLGVLDGRPAREVAAAVGDDLAACLPLLLDAQLLVSGASEQGGLTGHEGVSLGTWDFHDLLFHARSRGGRHAYASGAVYGREAVATEPVAHKTLPAGERFAMPPPSALPPVKLGQVLRDRHSIREHDDADPITLTEVATVLHHAIQPSARSSRPYPSGGGLYEQEIYLCVRACAGLPRGFYYYDSRGMNLVRLPASDDDMNGIMGSARASLDAKAPPQVVVSIAARFALVGWRYRSIAYATMLRNAGALYQTFYLVAQALGLAACGIGNGDIDRFQRITGQSFLEEGTVGEFALGRRP
ncbi:hypothetical protein VW23_012395 [Devosia insulae DS-56]|uniref:Uncharacterized protein n=1 Tax=Devosia insulae DS-56 TaxID=1116389 RepID=A0A1E5XUF8_9HYPH|nr:SagB family peptide dehydrogenase [Devosia insulae]OEO32237.1 hypothetical protein VW23_012395 [Devosia insulae DS-56]